MKLVYVKMDYLGKVGVEKKQHAVEFRQVAGKAEPRFFVLLHKTYIQM